MNRARSILRSTSMALAIALAVVAAPLARAEVGVFTKTPQMSEEISIYALGITDGPDPWGYWQVITGNPHLVPLNAEGFENEDGPPTSILHPATGVAVVAWSRNSADGYDVVYSSFVAGAWTPPIVLAGGPEDELDPWLALGDDGTVHLFYWSAGATPAIWHRQAPADLSSWSAPVRVSQQGESACRPSGVEVDGELFVVYEVHDFGYGQTPRQIVLARRDPSGEFFPEVVAVSQNPAEPRPQLHRHGNVVWVDWIDAPLGQGGELAWTRRDAEGQWEPLRYEPFETIEERDWFVRGTVRAEAIR